MEDVIQDRRREVFPAQGHTQGQGRPKERNKTEGQERNQETEEGKNQGTDQWEGPKIDPKKLPRKKGSQEAGLDQEKSVVERKMKECLLCQEEMRNHLKGIPTDIGQLILMTSQISIQRNKPRNMGMSLQTLEPGRIITNNYMPSMVEILIVTQPILGIETVKRDLVHHLQGHLGVGQGHLSRARGPSTMPVGEMATEDLNLDPDPGQSRPDVELEINQGHCLLVHGDQGHYHHSQSGKKTAGARDHHHGVMPP